MMSRRSDRAERIVRLPCDNGIDRGYDRPGSAQRSSPRTRGKDSIGIDPRMTGFWHCAQNAPNMLRRVY
jgi:hypothetical protein